MTRPADRRVRLRARRPHRAPGADRPAARRAVVYFGDTGRFPYGPKPADEVLKYALEIADVLARPRRARCSSSRATARRPPRSTRCSERLDIPVIGVIEPGLRAAAARHASGRIGVIGTVGTIASGAYQRVGRRPSAGIDAHVRGVPRLRRVRRGRRRRLRPGARARRTAARAGPRRRRSTPWCSAARTTRCSPVRSATSWAGTSCWSRAPTRPRSRCATCSAGRTVLAGGAARPRDPTHTFHHSGDVETFRTSGALPRARGRHRSTGSGLTWS